MKKRNAGIISVLVFMEIMKCEQFMLSKKEEPKVIYLTKICEDCAKAKIISSYGRPDAHAKEIDDNSFNLFRDSMTWLEHILDEN